MLAGPTGRTGPGMRRPTSTAVMTTGRTRLRRPRRISRAALRPMTRTRPQEPPLGGLGPRRRMPPRLVWWKVGPVPRAA
eukprot:13461110-Alexandrium_andersonii.AAC.1